MIGINYIKNFLSTKKNVFGLQPYNHLCNEMIYRLFEVVSGDKKGGYNPVTTAYNREGLTTAYNAVMYCICVFCAAVVGCKRIWKIFYGNTIFLIYRPGRAL